MQDKPYCALSINPPPFCLSISMICCYSKLVAKPFTLDLWEMIHKPCSTISRLTVPRNVRKMLILPSNCLESFAANVRYMLQVIGAGATGKQTADWSQIWVQSDEYKHVVQEIQGLCEERKSAELQTFLVDEREYSMPWITQVRLATKRTFTSFWRDPNYLIGKYVI